MTLKAESEQIWEDLAAENVKLRKELQDLGYDGDFLDLDTIETKCLGDKRKLQNGDVTDEESQENQEQQRAQEHENIETLETPKCKSSSCRAFQVSELVH